MSAVIAESVIGMTHGTALRAASLSGILHVRYVLLRLHVLYLLHVLLRLYILHRLHVLLLYIHVLLRLGSPGFFSRPVADISEAYPESYDRQNMGGGIQIQSKSGNRTRTGTRIGNIHVDKKQKKQHKVHGCQNNA